MAGAWLNTPASMAAMNLFISLLSLVPVWVLQPHSRGHRRRVDPGFSPLSSGGALVSHSQNDEDLVLYHRYFYKVRHGFYIEVGRCCWGGCRGAFFRFTR